MRFVVSTAEENPPRGRTVQSLLECLHCLSHIPAYTNNTSISFCNLSPQSDTQSLSHARAAKPCVPKAKYPLLFRYNFRSRSRCEPAGACTLYPRTSTSPSTVIFQPVNPDFLPILYSRNAFLMFARIFLRLETNVEVFCLRRYDVRLNLCWASSRSERGAVKLLRCFRLVSGGPLRR